MSETPEWLSAITDPDVNKRTNALLTLAASPQATNVADQLAQMLEWAGRLLRMLSAFESAKTDETSAQFVSYCQDVVKYLPLDEIRTEISMDWGEQYYPERGYCLWGGGLHGGLKKGSEAMWLLESGGFLAIHMSESPSLFLARGEPQYKSTTERPVEPRILASQSQQAIRVVRITASSVYETYRHLVTKNDSRRKQIAWLLFDSTESRDSSVRSNTSSAPTVSKAQRHEQALIMRQRQRDQVEQNRQQAAEGERKRESEREGQRERLRLERKSLGLCIVCGNKLGVLDRAFGLPQHKQCC